MVCAWFKLLTASLTLWNYCCSQQLRCRFCTEHSSPPKRPQKYQERSLCIPCSKTKIPRPLPADSRLPKPDSQTKPARAVASESRILYPIMCKLMDNFPISILSGTYKLETAICCEVECNAVFQEWSKVLQKMFLTHNAVRIVYINLLSAPVLPSEIQLVENLC